MPIVPPKEARIGDVVEIVGHRVGDAPRTGEIVEIVEGSARNHFRIRWEDGHESMLYPGADIAVVRSPPRRSRAKAPGRA